MNRIHIALVLLFSTLLFACTQNKQAEVKHSEAEHAAEAKGKEVYSCSMHPQVRSDKPGRCPICGMELTKIDASQAKAEDKAIHLAEAQLVLANIKTDTAKIRSLDKQLVLTGNTNYDQREKDIISAKVNGRIEKLYVRNPGETIHKGQKLYDLYSEEFLSAQKEYLLALKQKPLFKEASIDFSSTIAALKRKMELWGITPAQLNALTTSGKTGALISIYSTQNGILTAKQKEEGAYVNEGDAIFDIARTSDLWVEAQVYDTELSQLKNSTNIKVEIAAYPGELLNGKVAFNNPTLAANTRVNLVSIMIQNSTHTLRPGMLAYVYLGETTGKKALVVPKSAVVYGSGHNTIWIKRKDGAFEPRKVQVGEENKKAVEIINGLHEGELVVISGAYLLQSEFSLKFGQEPQAHTHN